MRAKSLSVIDPKLNHTQTIVFPYVSVCCVGRNYSNAYRFNRFLLIVRRLQAPAAFSAQKCSSLFCVYSIYSLISANIIKSFVISPTNVYIRLNVCTRKNKSPLGFWL